jgi:hypothetical protein
MKKYGQLIKHLGHEKIEVLPRGKGLTKKQKHFVKR